MAAANEVRGNLCAPGLVVASAGVSSVGICGDETVDREVEVRRAVAAVAFIMAEVAGRLAAFVAPGAEPGERLDGEAGGAGRESVAASHLAAWLNRKGCPDGALRQADSAADRANAA